ncbi:hypothetical protein BU16DRAFT_532540 [Lophium mytilinum]|uniref:Uncharacterized protein n=1 Tax=Lophium mytilinum TaxID=390894 RepID=A0A6A6RCN3_9PEZI|nr:hypothetical protein BU16DRAFT_532540 [Lophium mytilinum]
MSTPRPSGCPLLSLSPMLAAYTSRFDTSANKASERMTGDSPSDTTILDNTTARLTWIFNAQMHMSGYEPVKGFYYDVKVETNWVERELEAPLFSTPTPLSYDPDWSLPAAAEVQQTAWGARAIITVDIPTEDMMDQSRWVEEGLMVNRGRVVEQCWEEELRGWEDLLATPQTTTNTTETRDARTDSAHLPGQQKATCTVPGPAYGFPIGFRPGEVTIGVLGGQEVVRGQRYLAPWQPVGFQSKREALKAMYIMALYQEHLLAEQEAVEAVVREAEAEKERKKERDNKLARDARKRAHEQGATGERGGRGGRGGRGRRGGRRGRGEGRGT